MTNGFHERVAGLDAMDLMYMETKNRLGKRAACGGFYLGKVKMCRIFV